MAIITRTDGPSDATAASPSKTEFLRRDGTYQPVLALSGGTMTGPLIPAVVTLTDAATIAVDASKGNDFRVTLGGSRTLASPSNPADGQVIRFQVTQDGAGSRTLSYGSAYDFGTAGSPTLTATAAAVDILGFAYNAALGKWCYLGSALGF